LEQLEKIKQNLMNDRKLKVTWTREMLDDLRYFGSTFEYKYENKTDREIVEKHFNSDFTSGDCIYYTLTRKMLRKVKLLVLANDKLAEKLQYIINNSKPADVANLLERKLSEDIAKEIDNRIISDLQQYINEYK